MEKADLLNYIIENGIIDLNAIQNSIYMKEKEKILNEAKIWQGKDERWYAKIELNGETKLRSRKTKEEIENFVVQCETDKKDDPTVRDIFYQCYEKKLRYKDISKSTFDRYEADYIRYIKNTDLEEMKFRNLTEDYLEDFIRCTIADKELTSKGYANLRTILRGMLLYAKGRYTDISAKSFFGDLQFSKNTFRRNVLYKEEQVYTEEEINTVVSYLKRHKSLHTLGILLAFETGMRVGEITALKTEDIVYEKDILFIHVQRTETKFKVNKSYKILVKDYPKTSAGDRYVFCTKNAEEIVKEILSYPRESEYLFEINGRRFHERMFDNAIRKICNRLDIQEKSMHKIRKTYGTTLIDAGVDESIITEQMGHSDIHCTKQYYYYSNKSREKKKEQLQKASII